MPLANRRSER